MEVTFILPLVLLPGVALLIVSTSTRQGQLHDEIHRFIEKSDRRGQNHFRQRARRFRDALVGLYLCVSIFALTSLVGVILEVLGLSSRWPISYSELEPYYSQAEKLYSVHGQAGIDPTEPPRSAPYPHAPLMHEPRVQQLEDDLQQLGYKPFPLPLGVRLGNENSQPGSVTQLSAFDGYPDLTESKADAHVIGIKPALEYDNVTLKIDSYVERLGYIGCQQHLIPIDYYLGTQLPFNLAHQCGTMKFGTETATSVLDTQCRPHELENVYVTDGSFFVSAGAVNPSLTIIANTLRVADHLKQSIL